MLGDSMGFPRETERGQGKQQEEMSQILSAMHNVFTNLLKPGPTPGRNINEKNELNLHVAHSNHRIE